MIEYSEYQVEQVLEAIGVRIGGEAPNDIIVFCPYHSNHRTPAAEVSKETGVFYCFACQQHASLVDLVGHETSMTYFESLRLIDKYGSSVDIVDSVKSRLDRENPYEPFDMDLIGKLHQGLMNDGRAKDYMTRRGISPKSRMEYILGYSSNMDMIIFPYYDPTGQFIVGFQGRSIKGKEFKNSTGTKKSQTLFGIHLHKWDSEVFLFESPIDSILAHQHGIPSISSMGANPSNCQVELLTRHFKTVYVVSDNDPAGRASAFKLTEKLDGRGIMVLPPEGCKDIGEMPYAEIPQWAARVKNPVNILGD